SRNSVPTQAETAYLLQAETAYPQQAGDVGKIAIVQYFRAIFNHQSKILAKIHLFVAKSRIRVCGSFEIL
ncbi:hypothetical protein, partial [Paenibacillus cisolokensis]|uniref:hypothetical protein n=1 Tax=Paenibacillus cisolokensis TaxID=1658519 RepID=UPI001BD04674